MMSKVFILLIFCHVHVLMITLTYGRTNNTFMAGRSGEILFSEIFNCMVIYLVASLKVLTIRLSPSGEER